jgi:endoglucanase
MNQVLQRSTIKKIALLLIIAIATLPGKTQGFLRADGKRITNEKGQNVLLKGIGLGGWMLQEGYMLRVNGQGQQHKIRARISDLIGEAKTREFYDAWLANHTRKIDIDSLKAWGFNSVRLPMHYNLYTLPVEQEPVAGQNTWLEKGFRMTDSLLAWCKANGIYLILDLHAAPGGQGNDLNISDRDASKPSLWESEANQQKTIALWRKLAQRYAGEPWMGGYDILNEPNWGFEDPANDKNGLKEKKNEPLKSLLVAITKAIREVDQKHIIIIEGNGWGNNYNGMLPPWDKNMVLSFHKYWNYNNQASIQHILDTREQYNVPVWLGETGENSNVWFSEAIHLLETHNIGWAWWPLKKLGNNNPIQIQSNPDYEKILAFWSGKGSKPTETEAYTGIMALAEAAKTENAVVKRDVLDALLRQPFSDATLPYKQHQIKNGTVINVIDYDLGRNGTAYFDTDTADYHISNGSSGGNKGRNYRNDGVDILKESASGDYYISHTEQGEWLQYTTFVPEKGIYTLKLLVASDKNEGKITVVLNNHQVRRTVPVPNTLSKWQEIEIKNIALSPGKNIFRLYVDYGGFNLKSIYFTGFKK